MNEWEAKYKILASGIADKKSIEDAERLVAEAVALSKRRGASLESIVDLMLYAVRLETPITENLEQALRNLNKKKITGQTFEQPNYLGFPIEVVDWLPANTVMIFGSFGAVITDLQTGECKMASKEDLEKALRNVTKNV